MRDLGVGFVQSGGHSVWRVPPSVLCAMGRPCPWWGGAVAVSWVLLDTCPLTDGPQSGVSFPAPPKPRPPATLQCPAAPLAPASPARDLSHRRGGGLRRGSEWRSWDRVRASCLPTDSPGFPPGLFLLALHLLPSPGLHSLRSASPPGSVGLLVSVIQGPAYRCQERVKTGGQALGPHSWLFLPDLGWGQGRGQ